MEYVDGAADDSKKAVPMAYKPHWLMNPPVG